MKKRKILEIINLLALIPLEFFFSLVDCVEERLWWPIQSPKTGGKKKASS